MFIHIRKYVHIISKFILAFKKLKPFPTVFGSRSYSGEKTQIQKDNISGSEATRNGSLKLQGTSGGREQRKKKQRQRCIKTHFLRVGIIFIHRGFMKNSGGSIEECHSAEWKTKCEHQHQHRGLNVPNTHSSKTTASNCGIIKWVTAGLSSAVEIKLVPLCFGRWIIHMVMHHCSQHPGGLA